MKSFGVFVKRMSKLQGPVEDLARDLEWDMRDTGLKASRLKTPAAFKKYLEKHNACDGAFDALDEAAELWERMRKK